jgi:hypothetical protein
VATLPDDWVPVKHAFAEPRRRRPRGLGLKPPAHPHLDRPLPTSKGERSRPSNQTDVARPRTRAGAHARGGRAAADPHGSYLAAWTAWLAPIPWRCSSTRTLGTPWASERGPTSCGDSPRRPAGGAGWRSRGEEAVRASVLYDRVVLMLSLDAPTAVLLAGISGAVVSGVAATVAAYLTGKLQLNIKKIEINSAANESEAARRREINRLTFERVREPLHPVMTALQRLRQAADEVGPLAPAADMGKLGGAVSEASEQIEAATPALLLEPDFYDVVKAADEVVRLFHSYGIDLQSRDATVGSPQFPEFAQAVRDSHSGLRAAIEALNRTIVERLRELQRP